MFRPTVQRLPDRPSLHIVALLTSSGLKRLQREMKKSGNSNLNVINTRFGLLSNKPELHFGISLSMAESPHDLLLVNNSEYVVKLVKSSVRTATSVISTNLQYFR